MRIKRFFFVLTASLACFFFMAMPAFADETPGISYCSHVENDGWQGYAENGDDCGTIGQALRMEAVKIRLNVPVETGLGVEYRVHVQDNGWQDWVSNDELAGTTGQAKKIEAISVKLVGNGAEQYSVNYRVHCQSYGWLDWAKDGENAGTEGLNKRMEAMEIQVTPVEESLADPDGSDDGAFLSLDEMGTLHYKTHVRNLGWTNYCFEDEMSGDIAENEPIESISMGVNSTVDGGVEYSVLSTDLGWQDWAADGEYCGTTGLGEPIQAVRIQLTGEAASQYDIYYRSYIENYGWLNWASNGEPSGSEEMGLAVLSLQVTLREKGSDPPGSDYQAFVGPTSGFRYPLDDYHSISSYFGNRGGGNHEGVDFPAPEGTPIHAVESGIITKSTEEYTQGVGYGKHVVEELETGETVIYGHMIRTAVQEGQTVQKGDILGYVGNTGNSYGNHVHLEIRDSNYTPVDPLTYYPNYPE